MSKCRNRSYILKTDVTLSKGDKGEKGKSGESSYLYIRYASDVNGNDFSEIANINRKYIGILSSNMDFIPQASDFVFTKYIGLDGNNGISGPQSFIYIAYASDSIGNNFSLNPGINLDYIGILNSNIQINNLISSDFEGLWKLYKGNAGLNGNSIYSYTAYADDILGNGFTLIFNSSKKYIANIVSNVVISSPTLSDFFGRWVKYIGEDGQDGREIEFQVTQTEIQWRYIGTINWNTLILLSSIDGQDGQDGQDGTNVYLYIGYADDFSGTNFTLEFDDTKEYIGILKSDIEITEFSQNLFSWVRYKGSGDRWATTSDTTEAVTSNSMSLIIEPNLSYTTGQTIVAAKAGVPNVRIEGIVQTYNKFSGLIIINPTATFGDGTIVENWEVNISGNTAKFPKQIRNIDGGEPNPLSQIVTKIDGGLITL